ncbi:MAG TPA: hypothetical protein VL371_04155 [Gemmataceae bacterium]|jgi:hypothetical protein|nr:hypothetical protein [Gemmataceae bacterium]
MLRKCCFVFAMNLALLAGCNSGRCIVTGTVSYEDGSPVQAGSVIGEATVDGKLVAVQGTIKNGNFSWGGAKEGDGALPGQYKVIVVPISLSEYQLGQGMTPAVDSRFGKYETSGLSFEVKPGKNEFNIKVTKPKNSRRGPPG